MRKITLICLFIVLSGCGRTEKVYVRGIDGESCTTQEHDKGAIIKCGDSEVIIADGKDGEDGLDGIDGIDGKDGEDAVKSQFDIVGIIDPCGDNPDQFDEIILVLRNGMFLAYFEQDKHRFLSFLRPGEYRTTDKQKCRFKITEDGEYKTLEN